MNCALCWGKAKDVPAVTIVNGHAICADHFIVAAYWQSTDRSNMSYNFLQSPQAQEIPHVR